MERALTDLVPFGLHCGEFCRGRNSVSQSHGDLAWSRVPFGMPKNYVFQADSGYDAEHSLVEDGNWHAIVIIISEWSAEHK